MNPRHSRLLAVLSLAAAPLLGAPPPAPPDPEALARQAAELPNHGSLKLELALALARAGRTREALAWLERAASLGIGADVAALRAAFGAAAGGPEFARIARRFEDNVAPLVRGEVALRLSERDLFPESVAWDPVERAYYRVQNALRHGPERVVQAFLDPSRRRVTCVATLERRHPLYDIPTTGVLMGDELHYVATSQLRSFEEEGRPWPLDKLKETINLKVPLLKQCPEAASGREADRDALLRRHALGREAHFRTDPDLLLEGGSEEFVSVSGGKISRVTPAGQRKFFGEYFKDATYHEWDDVEPPIVKVSDDGTMAWVITRTRVRRSQKDASGAVKEGGFVYAGIMLYEKRDGQWVRVGNVSTFEP